ncbi:RNA polymerase subunit sigma [Ralstonia solanacearum]|nr:RNA polymerase subunit sigma [Ralstonia solanacearum]
MHERAAVAHQLAALPHDRRQLVLDEWDGSMGGGQIKRPWLFFASLVAKASGPGWVPEYADRVRDAREQQVRADAALRSQRLAPVVAPQAPKSLSPAVLRLRALVKPRGSQ